MIMNINPCDDIDIFHKESDDYDQFFHPPTPPWRNLSTTNYGIGMYGFGGSFVNTAAGARRLAYRSLLGVPWKGEETDDFDNLRELDD